MFSGILYCADCGKKLSFHRRANDPDTKHNFVCSNYRSDTHNCSMHYIRNVVVEQLVLENLREVVSYVKAYEDEFVQMVMDADIKQKSKELAKKKRVLSDKEKRYTQLDGLFQRIYEDNVSGKLSDERFVKLSQGYEAEQKRFTVRNRSTPHGIVAGKTTECQCKIILIYCQEVYRDTRTDIGDCA